MWRAATAAHIDNRCRCFPPIPASPAPRSRWPTRSHASCPHPLALTSHPHHQGTPPPRRNGDPPRSSAVLHGRAKGRFWAFACPHLAAAHPLHLRAGEDAGVWPAACCCCCRTYARAVEAAPAPIRIRVAVAVTPPRSPPALSAVWRRCVAVAGNPPSSATPRKEKWRRSTTRAFGRGPRCGSRRRRRCGRSARCSPLPRRWCVDPPHPPHDAAPRSPRKTTD